MRPRLLRRLVFLTAIVALIAAVPLLVVRTLRTPSNERQWNVSQRILPRVTVDGDRVEIRNIRDFRYRSESDFDVYFVDRSYDLGSLDSVGYVVSRFGSAPGLAHAFLTFGFGDDHVAISVEARKEAGESYSPLRGLMREYELTYVIGTERDVIGVRTNIWKESVSLYPIRADRDAMRRVFLDMVRRADALAEGPEFYDTITNSCNSNIVAHVNAINPRNVVPFGIRTILPGFSDRVAHELGLIDSDAPLEQIRETFRLGHSVPLDDDFSRNIRRGIW